MRFFLKLSKWVIFILSLLLWGVVYVFNLSIDKIKGVADEQEEEEEERPEWW